MSIPYENKKVKDMTEAEIKDRNEAIIEQAQNFDRLGLPDGGQLHPNKKGPLPVSLEKCSRCKKILELPSGKGGCTCSNSHISNGGKIPAHIDYSNEINDTE